MQDAANQADRTQDETKPENGQEQSSDSRSKSDESKISSELPSHLLTEEFARRYQILRKLADGGMGTIYEAQHVILNRRVALKTLKRSLTTDPLSIARFEREARACAALSHPNLVQMLDCGLMSDGRPFLVMEFSDGLNLLELSKDPAKYNLIRFINIFIQVCSGLAFAHFNGVIHRDLKPENIVVTAGPEGTDMPKIVDFGIAKIEEMGGLLQVLTQTGELLGSPSYMSPEQCQGSTVDARSDIYSLGCVMYEVFSGKQAFYGQNPGAIVFMQMRREPQALHEIPDLGIPKSVSRIVKKCLAKEPNDRYQSMFELHKDLVAVREHIAAKQRSGDIVIDKRVLGTAIAVIGMISFTLVATTSQKKNGETATTSNTVRKATKYDTTAMALHSSYLSSLGMGSSAEKEYITMLTRADKLGLTLADRLGVALVLMRYYEAHNHSDKIPVTFQYIRKPLEELQTTAATLTKEQRSSLTTSPLIYYYLGKAEQDSKATNSAESRYLSGIKLAQTLDSPGWVTSKLLQQYGICIFESRPEEAYKSFQSALKLIEAEGNPKTSRRVSERLVDINCWLFWSCQKLRRLEEGEKYLRAAIDLKMEQKDFSYASYLIGEMIKHKGYRNKKEEAAEWIEKQKAVRQLADRRGRRGHSDNAPP